MLRYRANVTVNIRSATTAVSNGNIIGTIPAGTEFIGSGLVTAPDGVKWVDLVSAGGINKDGFVSTKANITLIEDTGNPPPVDPPVVESAFPESFTLKGSDPKHISSYGKEAEYVFVRFLP